MAYASPPRGRPSPTLARVPRAPTAPALCALPAAHHSPSPASALQVRAPPQQRDHGTARLRWRGQVLGRRVQLHGKSQAGQRAVQRAIEHPQLEDAGAVQRRLHLRQDRCGPSPRLTPSSAHVEISPLAACYAPSTVHHSHRVSHSLGRPHGGPRGGAWCSPWAGSWPPRTRAARGSRAADSTTSMATTRSSCRCRAPAWHAPRPPAAALPRCLAAGWCAHTGHSVAWRRALRGARLGCAQTAEQLAARCCLFCSPPAARQALRGGHAHGHGRRADAARQQEPAMLNCSLIVGIAAPVLSATSFVVNSKFL